MAHVPLAEVNTVRNLKERLAQLHGVPRFRQRLLDDGESLQDTATVHPTDLQLVFLNYSEASLEQAAELTAAVGHGSVSEVEEILQRPQDPNQADADGNTPLIVAENAEIASLLLEAGADKDQSSCDSNRRTALGQAVQGLSWINSSTPKPKQQALAAPALTTKTLPKVRVQASGLRSVG